MTQKIDIYTMMRNEIKLLPYYLRHYETFASRIFVWDDGSDDGTREALEKHPLVTIMPCDLGKTLDDTQFVNRFWPQYETISRGKADWVVIADTDEFVYHPHISEKLEGITKQGFKKIFSLGYTMYHPVFPTTHKQIYDEIKLGWPDRWSKKTTVFNPEILIRWSHGRHYVTEGRRIPAACDTGINILHFRYLGHDYYKEKNIKNCESMHAPWKPGARHNLPDGSRGVPFVWYEEQRPKLKNVVDIYEL